MKKLFAIFIAIVVLGAGCQRSGSLAGLPSETKNNRVVLNPGNYDVSPELCTMQFSAAPANEFVSYVNDEYRISLQIPFNKDSGDATYRVPPYYETGKERLVVYFGGITPGPEPNCDLSRQFKLYSEELQALPEVIASLGEMGIAGTPSTKKINNLMIVEYYFAADHCEVPVALATVIGKRFNYTLSGDCGGNFAELEEIIKTIQLSD